MPAKAEVPGSGTKFGEWTFLLEIATGRWLCRCSCGVERVCARGHLVSGNSASCGHGLAERLRTLHIKHGLSSCRDRVYSCWKNAKSRCFDPKSARFERYGARGVTMYAPWRTDFEAFRAYVGEPPSARHSLGRVDNDGDYAPGNVEWQTPAEQGRNKGNNRLLTFEGKTQTISDWARERGMAYALLSARLGRLKWPLEKALLTPVRADRRQPGRQDF